VDDDDVDDGPPELQEDGGGGDGVVVVDFEDHMLLGESEIDHGRRNSFVESTKNLSDNLRKCLTHRDFRKALQGLLAELIVAILELPLNDSSKQDYYSLHILPIERPMTGA